ncbi:MAG: HIT family protein [Phycisphaerae bacterium]|nr:HIT family protein [Phycisphaerae bacterium]
MSNCIFCDIVNGNCDAAFVHRDDSVSVFMDIQPVNAGHMLIIPNTHAAFLADLEPNTGAKMFRVAQKMAEALRASGLKCEGVNLFLADGEAAMQEVFHVHLHVFPRFEGDGFGLTFADTYLTKPPWSELEGAAKMISTAIERSALADEDERQR